MLMASLLLLINSTVSMAETISFPEEIIPLQVDNRVLEGSLFSAIEQVELAPGQYQLKLKYSDLYEDGFDSHAVVESKPFWVNVTIEAEKDYTLAFNRANNVVAAKVFAESPNVSLKENASAISTPLTVLADVGMVLERKSALTVQSKQLNTVTDSPASMGELQAPNASEMLDFWWQQASVEQRNDFIKKVTK